MSLLYKNYSFVQSLGLKSIISLTTHTLSKEESQELVKQYEEHAQNLLLLVSSSQMVNLVSFYFIFYFYFIFVLFSYFSIFRTARVMVRSDWSYCHISHNMMVWSQH